VAANRKQGGFAVSVLLPLHDRNAEGFYAA
jgi:hypothetical protein